MENVPAAYADIDWEGLTHARRALIGNPYTTPQEDLDAAIAWFFEHKDIIPRAMVGLCEMNRPSDARKLVIAAIHAFVRIGSLSMRLRILCEALGPLRPRGVRLAPDDLVRLASAVERFHKAAGKMLGVSPAMNRFREEAWTLCFGPNLYDTLSHQAALRKLNVLILGETGTGKERVAEMIQAGSFVKATGPAITINCAAVPDDLAEAELFGAEKGAHSTATQRRDGKILAAHQGTLFLDEVADLSPAVQAKLLSTMSNGQLTPLGSNESMAVDVRYVAATSRPIDVLVETGSFREDLYQRLAGRTLTIPPLRDRREDIIEIGRHLLKVLRADSNDLPPGIVDHSSDIGGVTVDGQGDLAWLRHVAASREWPGNVRELEATIRQRVLGLEPQPGIHLRGPSGERLQVPERILQGVATEEEVVEWYMRLILDKTKGNLSETHRILNIDRSTIRRRLEKREVGRETIKRDRDHE